MTNRTYHTTYRDGSEVHDAIVIARSQDNVRPLLEKRLKEEGLVISEILSMTDESVNEGVLYDSQIEACVDCAKEGFMARNNNS